MGGEGVCTCERPRGAAFFFAGFAIFLATGSKAGTPRSLSDPQPAQLAVRGAHACATGSGPPVRGVSGVRSAAFASTACPVAPEPPIGGVSSGFLLLTLERPFPVESSSKNPAGLPTEPSVKATLSIGASTCSRTALPSGTRARSDTTGVFRREGGDGWGLRAPPGRACPPDERAQGFPRCALLATVTRSAGRPAAGDRRRSP